MMDIILKEIKGEENEEVAASSRAPVATPRALALMTTQKKSSDYDGTANYGGNSPPAPSPCKIWPWDMGMGFGPNSGLRVRC